MLPALAQKFRPRDVSSFSLRNFRYELISVAFMAAALACVDVNVLGVIADKAFHAGPWVITLIAASDAVANITSLFWTRCLHGADRVRSANILQFCTIGCVVAIAATPFNGAGIAILVTLTILARIFMTGIINARTDLWRANYPRDARARVIARFTIVATLVLAMTGLIIAVSMDLPHDWLASVHLSFLEGNAFRAIYLFAAVTAAIGARTFARVRWRGRAVQIKAERASSAAGGEHAASARNMIRILVKDRAYRRFMTAQFVLGAPNLAAVPIFILALRDHFDLNYTPSIALTRVIPIVVPVLVTPLWGRLLDRMHIIRFRSYHSWTFVASNILMAAAFLLPSLPMLYGSRIILGIGFAGGLLAWELGHHDFARRELAAVYMGIHVTLTGIRGIFAPFLGTLLYQHAGDWAFVVLAAVSTIGALMFVRLHLNMREHTRASPLMD